MIKVILFDIGDVLIGNYDNELYYNYLSKKNKINKKRFLREIDPLDKGIDSDIISLNELETRFAKVLDIDKTEVQYNKAFEKLARTNKAVVKIAEQLSKRYKMALLSDINKERYKVVESKFINTKLFNKIFLSYKLHLLKPDKRIFLHVIKGLKVKPNEILFIDNDIKNINGARKVGMEGILFNNAKQLKADINKM